MKRLVILLVLGTALLVPSVALANGVVVKVQPSAHLVAITTSSLHVGLFHSAAASRLHVGQRVTLSARKLRNGTFAASNLHVVGHASRVHFRGRLLAQTPTRWIVDSGGAVISVRRDAHATRDDHPRPGSVVDVAATIGADDELDDDDVNVVTAMSPGGTIEGRLTIGTGAITVSAEHLSLLIKVPAGLDLTAFRTGDEVVADFTQGADGTLTLSRLSTAAADEDTNDDNGDGRGGDGDHGGDGGGDSHGGHGR